MELNYRILWFDDQPQAIKPFVDRVNTIVARLGFDPVIDLRIITADVTDPLTNIPLQQEVDLVLMDWKLGGSHDGANLTRRVRQSYRDTDIIFYSSESVAKLRELIFNQGIDGVFCCNRTGLSDRATGIIQGQLRRTLDLNHMRGLVMATTSDLDHGMIECLKVVQKIAYPDAADFAMDVAQQVGRSLRKKADEVENLGKKGKITRILEEPAFGALLRLEVLQTEVSKLADRMNEAHLLEHLGTYHAEVITPRNDFAHRKAELKDGKLTLAGRDQPFDQEMMKALRLRLLKHSDNLRALLTLLSEMAVAAGEPELAEHIVNVVATVADASETAGAAPIKRLPLKQGPSNGA